MVFLEVWKWYTSRSCILNGLFYFLSSYFLWYLKQFASFQEKAHAESSSALLQGKMKSIYDHTGMKAMESTVKGVLDPTPKHECHVSKNANKVTSLLAYRAYELTQVKLSLSFPSYIKPSETDLQKWRRENHWRYNKPWASLWSCSWVCVAAHRSLPGQRGSLSRSHCVILNLRQRFPQISVEVE